MTRAVAGVWVTMLCLGCTIAPATDGLSPATAAAELPPPGYGTLVQSDVSLSLVSRELQIMVTPLAESITRVTAPDTYARLAGMARANRSEAPPGSVLFLVSFYTDEADIPFSPEEIQFVASGLRLSPLVISPVTPGWGQRRVRQQDTEMAVYAFPEGVDLETDIVLVYGFEQTAEWSAKLPRIQAERARARARSGIGDPIGRQPSRSYFEIFR